MSVIWQALGLNRRSIEQPAVPLNSTNLIAALTGGVATATGRTVSNEGALKAPAVFAAVRALAESMASVPLLLHRRLPAGGKARASELPLYGLLHDLPNPEITSFDLVENIVGHAICSGWACNEIERDGAGRIRALWPLRPDRTQVLRLDDAGLPSYSGTGPLVYLTDIGGELIPLPANRVWRIRGFGLDSVVGLSQTGQGREAIGLALATEEYQARFYANDSRPGGLLKSPGTVSDTALKRVRNLWQGEHAGLSNAHRIAVLEQGWDWVSVATTAQNAQLLENRQFQREEVAALLRVPLHMIQGAGNRAQGWSTLEHLATEFVVFSLLHWARRIEQSIYRDLLTPAERTTLFAQFLFNGLLRGDIKTRYAAYAVGRQWGWLSADDVRELEDMNPLPDSQGQIYLSPLNMGAASQIGADKGGQDDQA